MDYGLRRQSAATLMTMIAPSSNAYLFNIGQERLPEFGHRLRGGRLSMFFPPRPCRTAHGMRREKYSEGRNKNLDGTTGYVILQNLLSVKKS